ncbi:MAG TPA: hypothetical protein GXX57_03180 [Firmicutes bacterium]|nr:hypothetical protein [Bacillota bacterium]
MEDIGWEWFVPLTGAVPHRIPNAPKTDRNGDWFTIYVNSIEFVAPEAKASI